MSEVSDKSIWDEPVARWLVWFGFVIVWTTGLLVPLDDGSTLEETQRTLRCYAGKALHVVGYAGLTVLSGWLRVSFPRRLLLLLFTAVHAPLTEVLQPIVSNRTGLLTDVALDYLGIGLGLLLTWRWWSAST